MTEQRKSSFVHFARNVRGHHPYLIIAVEVYDDGKRIMHFAAFPAYVVEHAGQGADLRSVYSADIVVSNRFSSGGTHKDSMAVFMHIVNTLIEACRSAKFPALKSQVSLPLNIPRISFRAFLFR